MKKKVTTTLILIGVFLFLLIFNMILSPLTMDEVWAYGFTHNLYTGLVPYRDFNMIVPPLYVFIMSIPFYIFGSNMLVFHAENALLLTGMMVVLYKLIGKKTILVVPFFLFPHNILLPNYNVLLLVLFFLLLYLEKEEKNDLIIGIVLGFLILTKHTVGVCLLFPSLFYWKKKEKIKNRIIGLIIPCIIFFIYLLCTHTLKIFLDLGVFGLFDFGKSNHGGLNLYFLLVLFLIATLIYVIFRKKQDIRIYYTLCFVSMTIPLFDYYHVWMYMMAYLVVILSFIKIEKPHIYFVSSIILLSVLTTSISQLDLKQNSYPNTIKHFEYRYLDPDFVETVKHYNSILKEYNGHFVIVGKEGYLHKISLNQKATYLDMLCAGNFGYHGQDKLIKIVKNEPQDTIYLVSKSEMISNSQIDKNLITFMQENGELVDEDDYYYYYFLK